MRPADEHEPGRGAAAFLAVLMHILFFILLVFGINWQSKHPQITAVDLWSDMPPSPQPVATPLPAPEIKAPPPPQPEAKPEPKLEPKPEAKPEPVKPDILLKEKAEKERAEKEKAEKEKRKREEQQQKLAEAKRKVEAKQQRQIKEQSAKEDEERQLQKDREAALKAMQSDLAAAKVQQDHLITEYISKIQVKIRHDVVVPPDIQGNPQAVYKVVLLPGGDVLSATLVKSSGVPAYDSSIERAIYKAQPLPLPPDPAQFPKFRELELQFRPND